MELELDSVNAPDELQMNTMTQKQQTEGDEDKAGIINSDTNNSNANNNKNDRIFETVCLHCGACGNRKIPHRKMLQWNQCSKQATCLEELTGQTEPTSSTRRTEQYNDL